MKYFFILGRNTELSIVEIKSYFENLNLRGEFTIVENILLAKFNEKLSLGVIKKLGGSLAMGEILAEGKISEIESQLDKMEIYSGTKNNFTYTIWNFSNEENYERISVYLKQRFKNERFKATRKNLNKTLDLQSGKKIPIPTSSVTAEYFLLLDNSGNLFGRVIEKTNPEEIEERDMKKPFRRKSLAISPRLSKIMINLSGVKKNQILLDPFCGIGVILIEALVQNINVIGIDKDPEAIEGARQNLGWGKLNKEKYTLINSDSSEQNIQNSEAIVTEPDLGETLKKIPPKEKTKKILYNYENLMINVFNNLKQKISGKIVFTAPYILQLNHKRKGCNIGRILNGTNLTLKKGFPLEEIRENQIVSRQIFVLER